MLGTRDLERESGELDIRLSSGRGSRLAGAIFSNDAILNVKIPRIKLQIIKFPETKSPRCSSIGVWRENGHYKAFFTGFLRVEQWRMGLCLLDFRMSRSSSMQSGEKKPFEFVSWGKG